jgi:hypothetical protein
VLVELKGALRVMPSPTQVLVELEGALRVMPNKDGGRILLDTGEVAGWYDLVR